VSATIVKKPKSRLQRLINGALFISIGLVVALLASRGTWALWNGQAATGGAPLVTGSIGLTVNGATTTAIGFPTNAMAPGSSRVAAVTVANTGSVKVSAVGTVAITGSTAGAGGSNAIAQYLTLTATQVSSASACTAGLTGGTTMALSSWTNSGAPYDIPAGVSVPVCFELKLSATAPQSVQGATTSFSVNITGTQKRG
jgi:hypothetical protein